MPCAIRGQAHLSWPKAWQGLYGLVGTRTLLTRVLCPKYLYPETFSANPLESFLSVSRSQQAQQPEENKKKEQKKKKKKKKEEVNDKQGDQGDTEGEKQSRMPQTPEGRSGIKEPRR